MATADGSARARSRSREKRAAPALAQPCKVDLRSDTVTKPSSAMLAAMTAAPVGDDVLGDDPTVQLLEQRVAAFFGKEASLFVPSGTMSNLIAVMAHTWERGSEYIVGDRAHIYIWEQGGAAQFGGSHPRAVRTHEDGTFDLQEVADAVRADNPHFPITKVVCVEDTHNMCGGRILPASFIRDLGALAHQKGLKLHLDGARFWNALAATGEDPKVRAAPADSISVCFSKGMGTPLGSVLVGSAELIKRARRLRKGLGGGMRQSGVVAAAALYALEHNLPLLAKDHERAKRLAAALTKLPGFKVDMTTVQSNILMVDLAPDCPKSAQQIVEAVGKQDVLCLPMSTTRIRLVTHLDVTDEGVDHAIRVFEDVMRAA